MSEPEQARAQMIVDTHVCHTPPDALPGDVYVCDCGNSFLAVDTPRAKTEWDRLNDRNH